MKIKKIIGLMLAVTLLSGVFAFAACGGGEDGGGGAGNNTYVMEAEYVDIADVVGSGLSSDQSGYSMIYGSGSEEDKAKGWSSGYYVGYTYTAEFSMDFVFNAEAEATATIVLRLGTELSGTNLTPDIFPVKLNGKEIRYNNIYLETSDSMSTMKFEDKTITTTAQLVKGRNTINLSVKANSLRGSGSTGGPTIDCIKVRTDTKLDYTEHTDNPSKKDDY